MSSSYPLAGHPTYAAKAAELERERRGLDPRVEGLTAPVDDVITQVEALLLTGSTAYSHVEEADEELKRRILSEVLCNLHVEDGRIASYQYKGPYGVLQEDSNGALLHSWRAIIDELRTA
jgi:hypothetical protein